MEADQTPDDVTDPSEMKGPAPTEDTSGPADLATLVERLVEAGEWPDPALLDQIAAAGEAALGPLLAFMQTYPSPKDHEREIAFYHAIGLLGAIRSPAAMPVLIEILRRYHEDDGELAAEVLGDLGPIAFEPALDLVLDPTMTGSYRQNAISAAKRAAGNDSALRARLADAIRPLLADALERTREEARLVEEAADKEEGEESGWTLEDLDDEGDFDEEEESDDESSDEMVTAVDEEEVATFSTGELEAYEELMFLIGHVADLADPKARGLIDAAFQEDLVETFWINQKDVERSYREGGSGPRPRRDWLEDYRKRYQSHLEWVNRPVPTIRPIYRPAITRDDSGAPVEPAPRPVQAPIRNEGPKLGRNDPCWCGSGKKYKKCHWGKPGP